MRRPTRSTLFPYTTLFRSGARRTRMTTATAAMAAPQSPPTLDRLATWLLWLFVASLQMSIAAAGVLLALLVVCWVALLVRDRMRPSAPSFFLPLVVYAALTLISSAFSWQPWTSFADDKQLIYLVVVPIVYDLAREIGRA